MHEANASVPVLLLFCGASAGCGASPQPPAAPAAPATPSEGAGERPQLTAEACQSSGGTVVGDIGDGAIHKPDYRCPSGAAPSGSIRPPPGGPIAIEGSVCCPK
jgi:hypothetical protein